ncbi:hypothetical protein M9Y10_042728 [Tritrichomonas musculus]|uniref:Uncharacterized protein n=1 Tax=Tritrichomonas musculus TaxID=1915356 RepID=A0ABR2JYB7_9EUKA
MGNRNCPWRLRPILTLYRTIEKKSGTFCTFVRRENDISKVQRKLEEEITNIKEETSNRIIQYSNLEKMINTERNDRKNDISNLHEQINEETANLTNELSTISKQMNEERTNQEEALKEQKEAQELLKSEIEALKSQLAEEQTKSNQGSDELSTVPTNKDDDRFESIEESLRCLKHEIKLLKSEPREESPVEMTNTTIPDSTTVDLKPICIYRLVKSPTVGL